MVFDEQKKKELQDIFKSVYSLQDEAKTLNATASDNLKALAERWSAVKGEQKDIFSSIKKAYKEWKEKLEGKPDTLDLAIDMLAVLEDRKSVV